MNASRRKLVFGIVSLGASRDPPQIVIRYLPRACVKKFPLDFDIGTTNLHPAIEAMLAILGICAGILGIPLILLGIGVTVMVLKRPNDASYSSDLVAAAALCLLGLVLVLVSRALWKLAGGIFTGR